MFSPYICLIEKKFVFLQYQNGYIQWSASPDHYREGVEADQ
jgi:hypothetical protein